MRFLIGIAFETYQQSKTFLNSINTETLHQY